jgi:hypothetical protein
MMGAFHQLPYGRNMRTPTAAVAAVAALLALTACSSLTGEDKPPTDKPAAGKDVPSAEEQAKARAEAGVPDVPTGDRRAELIAAIAKVSPGAAEHEEQAIVSAQNQCAAIHAKAPKLDWLAAQRFSYKGVKTTEAQGKELNRALKDGFCKI